MLEPYGEGNEQPVFRFFSVRIGNWKFLKNGTKYARFSIKKEDKFVNCILFKNAMDVYQLYKKNALADVYGTIEINHWHGQENVQMIVSAVTISKEADYAEN